jgi:archaellum biogenesis ATPase FlaH
VREKFNLKEVPIVWLTNAPKEMAMRPKDLEKLSLSIEHFLTSKGEGSIVMLDCIEYLITNNTFAVVLRFIQSLRDMVAINKAILIITANPATFEPQQLNLVEREVDVSV